MVCRFLLKDTSNLDKGPVLPLVFIWRDSPIREEITGEHWLSASLTIDLNKNCGCSFALDPCSPLQRPPGWLAFVNE